MSSNPVCACGFAYVVGHPEDERVHRELHAQYQKGPYIKALEELRQVGSIGALSVLIADRSTLQWARKAVAEVAYVARRGTDYKVGYDGTITDADPRLYIVANGLHAVAMSLIVTTTRSWLLRWMSYDRACLRSRSASQDPRPNIARFWTAADYRRKRIATHLFNIIVEAEASAPASFCWQLPFTDSGLSLARKLTATNWYGEGDMFDLDDILATPAECSSHLPPPV